MRFRAHLALMALVILLPVVVLSAAGLAILLRAEREAAHGAVRETARAIALSVDLELATAEAALRVLATSRYLAQRDFGAFYQQALQARTGEKSWIVLFDRDATQIVNTRFPLGTNARRSRPELVADVIQSQKTVVSDLYVGAVSKAPMVTLDVPVPVEGGQRYVLSHAFLPDYFNRTFSQRSPPPEWIILIFDGAGRTIARSRRGEESVGKPATPDLVDAARRRPEGVLQHPTREGIEVYTVFTHPSRANWTVAVGVPVEHLEAPARHAVTVAAVGMIVALAMAVLVAILLARRLAASIDATAQSATALGRAAVPVFTPTSITEIDRLQRTLSGAAQLLMREQRARAAAEAERLRLLESEQQARALAEAQNQAKDEFLAMLGHELRNPLGAISGAVSVLHSSAAGSQADKYAREVIARQAGHLGRIVDDLLDVSRVMTGKIRLDLQPVELSEAVRRCIATLTSAGRTSRHAIELVAQPAWIDADLTRLDQVINNLLINAVKYTPDGGRIAVAVRSEGGDAVLEVSDTGVGIPAALLARVFDIFVQGSASLDRGQGGLGLGLALVKRLAAMHGGSVSAESQGEGHGSRFTLRLPLRSAPDRSRDAPVAHDAPANHACRVLLVDDHEDARTTLRMLLELLGLAVSEASDGIEGLRSALDHPPEVAVVDIGLPGMDGYEVARRLRADARARGVGLIALTGYGQDEDRRRALEAGFDEHLVKPVDPQQLLAAIERVRPRPSEA